MFSATLAPTSRWRAALRRAAHPITGLVVYNVILIATHWPEVVDALKDVAARRQMTIAAPYDGLPDGTAVALAAWDQLQTCPETLTANQATTVANGFAGAFACTSNAPEANAADDC